MGVLGEISQSLRYADQMRHAIRTLLLFWMSSCVTAAAVSSQGEALYYGVVPLSGRISGQTLQLPARVLACVRCHEGRGGQAGGELQPGVDLLGGWLSQIRSRRNGPASQYTPATFCRALRNGIDPVSVVLAIQMPRFDISDQDCNALWNYLNSQTQPLPAP